MDKSRHIAAKFRVPFRNFLLLGCCLSVGFYLASREQQHPTKDISTTKSLVSAVNLIDSNQVLTNNLTCIKTKKLLNLYSTTICIHDGNDIVSTTIAKERVWEEHYVVRLLRIFVQNPQLDMIDIGSNIGSYTMFTAGALGRFTLAIDCYMPNIERIVRAVQIQKVQNRVVLVYNALYAKSGEYLKLSVGHPSGVRLGNNTQMKLNNQYVVGTIRFDDLLPILIERGVRAAVIKIDIEGSEVYLCETGLKVFERIDIQLVMMEWGHGFRKMYENRYQSMVEFFTKLNYVTTDEECTLLDSTKWRTTWPGNVYWIKQANFQKNIC